MMSVERRKEIAKKAAEKRWERTRVISRQSDVLYA